MAHDNPEVWVLLYDQMPPALRWILGILTLGLFTMVGILLKWYQRRLTALEQAKFMTREEHQQAIHRLEEKIGEGFTKTHERIDKWFKP